MMNDGFTLGLPRGAKNGTSRAALNYYTNKNSPKGSIIKHKVKQSTPINKVAVLGNRTNKTPNIEAEIF